MRRIGPLCSWTLVCALAAAGCDDPPEKKNPFENPAAPKQPPPITEPPKPEGPPEFSILAEGPKIGWTNILLEKKDGPERLRAEIKENQAHVSGKDVALTIDRKAQLTWVAQMLGALDEAGATGFEISTNTRDEFPKKVRLGPLSKSRSAAPCSVIGKVLSERKNAVWHLNGGTAVRSPKGLAGPDMAMTATNLDRAAKGCKDSRTFFISADPDVEWGLVYDLAAVTHTIEGGPFDTIALLPESPTAGRPVKLP